jgi:hypothetical protein
MSHTNAKSNWVDGNLVFVDKSGAEIATFDGTLRKFSIPSGSELEVAGVTVDETTLAADAQTGANVATLADVATDGGIPVVFRIDATALTGDVDVTVAYKIRVIDVVCVASAAGGASDTITVKNGATAITNAMDLNVSDKVVVRAGTIDDAAHEIDSAGTLRVSGASAATAIVYVYAIRVA